MEKDSLEIKDLTYKLLRKYGIRADKSLGQNFLIEENILSDIVKVANIKADDTVLEIGPGMGALTRKLAQAGCKCVIAVELDKRLSPILNDLSIEFDNLQIVYADILKLDIKELLGEGSFKVVANLPYYITTPILMHFLESDLNYERLVFMVQNEVAERMASSSGSKVYGSLSVAVQYRTLANIALTVPPEAFVPAPSVESAVIVCEKRQEPPVKIKDEKLFFQIVKAAFSQRRKMLSNTLKNMGLTAEQTNAWLELAGVDGKLRAEMLSLADFAKLENSFDKW